MNTHSTRPASRRRRPRVVLAIALVALVAAGFLMWAQRGLANCGASIVSPGGSYRVEVCTPAFSLLSMHGSMPRFVKFHDQKRQVTLPASAVVDFNGRGRIVWPTSDDLRIIVGLGDDAPSVRVAAPDGQ